MLDSSSVESLRTFREKIFAKHVLFDLPFPVVATLLVIAVNSWLMYSKVTTLQIGLWGGSAVGFVLMRLLVERRLRKWFKEGEGYSSALKIYAVLSIPIGAISGSFALLYFDANEPTTMIILGTYMAVVVVGAVVPTSVYLPAFYLLVLLAHLPYMVLLYLAGGHAHWVMLGLNLLFLMVTLQYAHAANRMHLESVKLRYENHRLIADLGERQAVAENAYKTKSLFLAGVSHDLKQPILAIGLYLGVLRHAKREDSVNVLETVTPKMENALGDLHGQVMRLLDLSRLESGAFQLQMEWVDLPEIFSTLNAFFDAHARRKGLRLRFAEVANRHGKVVWVDKRMLESILQNLISNAIKQTSNGAVYVGTRVRIRGQECRQLCIEVRDSGIGIPPEQHAFLFEAYRSFDDRQANESHGLGLAIAKAQAEYLNATILLRSATGEGSVFTVCGLRTEGNQDEQI